MKRLVLLIPLLALSACRLGGTDSGNPGLRAPVNSDCGADSPCAQANPAIVLIDGGLCGALQRCGSPLRGDDCRERVLASTVLPEHFGRPELADGRAFAIAVYERRLQTDGQRLGACLDALDVNACAQLPAAEELSPTLRALLAANPECTGVFHE